MALNPSIILAGTQPDILGAMSRGNELAAQTNTIRDQNALRQVYQAQGADLLAGKPQAINALAMIDPMTAANIRNTNLEGTYTAERTRILGEEEKRKIAEAARTMTEEQQKAALEATKREVFRFLAAPDAATFDQMVTQAGKPELVGQFERRQILAADYVSSVEEALKLSQGPEPLEWRDATPEEAAKFGAAAGQISTKTGAFKPFNPPRNTTTEVAPDGTLRIIQGSGAGGKTDVGDAISPAGIDEAKTLIKDILGTDDRTMARITGSVMGGGGNNVDEIPAFQRLYYGEEGVAVIEKLGQLGSQAWFAARDMLKGGGQITDYESKKAEAAVARLSRTKDPKELKAALQELYDAIEAGEEKLRAAGRLAPAATAPAAGAADFSNVDMNGLLAVDINTLDAAGMDAWEKRLNELQGGN